MQGKIIIVITLFISWFSFSAAGLDVEHLVIGSDHNLLIYTITNSSNKTIENAVLSISDNPSWLQFSDPSIVLGDFLPAETIEATFPFSVDPSPINNQGKIDFEISSNGYTWDKSYNSHLQVSVALEQYPSYTLVADFTNDLSPTTAFKVDFTNQSTPADKIQSIEWNFDDPINENNTSTLQNPSHTYSQAGEYEVALRITSQDSESKEVRKNIVVDNEPLQPLEANFTASPLSGLAPLSVDFNSESSVGDITSRSWSCTPTTYHFSASSNSESVNPTIVFEKIGTYTVVLQISDGE